MATIITEPPASSSLGSSVRAAVIAAVAVLLLAAFLTGRVTAPSETEIIRSVVTAPADDAEGPVYPCRLGRPC